MVTMTCIQCGTPITSTPCPHCGGDVVTHAVKVCDHVDVSDNLHSVIISGSSEITIHKDNEEYTYPFDPGTSSGEIVTASLMHSDLSGVTPTYIKNQLIENINSIERVATEPSAQYQTTHEHSFELNLGIFKYTYKRTTKT